MACAFTDYSIRDRWCCLWEQVLPTYFPAESILTQIHSGPAYSSGCLKIYETPSVETIVWMLNSHCFPGWWSVVLYFTKTTQQQQSSQWDMWPRGEITGTLQCAKLQAIFGRVSESRVFSINSFNLCSGFQTLTPVWTKTHSYFFKKKTFINECFSSLGYFRTSAMTQKEVGEFRRPMVFSGFCYCSGFFLFILFLF